jgi:hypothetical protein
MQEVQYGDILAHFKKNLLKGEEMGEEYSYAPYGNSYRNYSRNSYEGGSYDGMSYARGRGRNAKRDSRGRYSSDDYSRDYSREYSNEGYSRDEVTDTIERMMMNEPDERKRREYEKLLSKVNKM